ncbi:MAG TPA: PP2C family protein-serine/threonine phosphatase [Kiritimatiellia bacterium]|nr:PP2C family protein-serine/threonine phosphatase [Kiritimatiellia bacterium]HMO98557.1 PP2C family protein-serine/threonine phosphatase [Kiritimatiellia bacterium]HMP97567.1 PP2C family protein-serine/threonine phosphatase [Kiritimatiellia bacterium]
MPNANQRKTRPWALVVIALAVSLPFVLLYHVGQRSIINEVRQHAMGVAIATAAGLDVAHFERITGPEAIDTPAYRALQGFLDRISMANPDVKYLYTMRRSRSPLTPAWIVEYVVDQSPRDFNRDGIIDESEMSEPPGTRYDASRVPELLNGFYGPTADQHVTPDPPYPDLISGYAPVRNDQGEVIGIVGADITAKTIAAKMAALQVVIFLVWLVITSLLICVFLLYQSQRASYMRIAGLSHDLATRNDMLRAANQELARMNRRFEEDLRLAQRVQLGFLPSRFPRHDRVEFDQYYLTCDILGGDLYDVFEIDSDHVGLYIADVAGHGVGAALVSGLLKMAVSTIRQTSVGGTTSMLVDMTQPDQFLKSVNNVLVKEMPEGEFITLIYCVFDLLENRLLLASAGHPHPVLYRNEQRQAQWCQTRNGMALGLQADTQYPCVVYGMQAGDVILFYTDGLTEAMNAEREEFGEEHLLEIVNRFGASKAARLNEAIRAAVETHRAGCDVSDDFTLLAVDIR